MEEADVKAFPKILRNQWGGAGEENAVREGARFPVVMKWQHIYMMLGMIQFFSTVQR